MKHISFPTQNKPLIMALRWQVIHTGYSSEYSLLMVKVCLSYIFLSVGFIVFYLSCSTLCASEDHTT